MPKFFVKQNQIKDNEITIIGTDVNHIVHVLRLKINDEIKICNEENSENYMAKIAKIDKEKVTCNIVEKIVSNTEANVNITIFQGLPKVDKMELIIQKCTELGVKEITPVEMKRCVVKLDEKNANKKIERWQKIAEVAAKQSGRDNICKINNVINIKNICNICQNYDILLVPYENEEEITLKDVVKKLPKNISKIGIVIGPEGGFEEEEIEFLEQNNCKIITLGKRILRTETVAMVMSSIILYELSDFGGN